MVTGDGGGTFESLGDHRWRLSGQDVTSDGHNITTEGEIDLASMTYRGKVYE